MKFWRMIRGWLLVLLVVAGTIAAIQYFLLRPVPVEVRVYRVQKGLVEETVSSTKAGSVRSRRVAEISVEAPGTIVEIHAREGAEVKKGAPLVSLDRRDAAAATEVAKKELASAEAAVAEAQARWADAVRERDRVRELIKTESAPRAQVDQAETLEKVTAAALSAAKARVELQKSIVERAELALAKCDIFAPFDGVVATLASEVGEWAVPGRMVMRIIDPKELYVRAELDEVDIGQIRTGLEARVTLDPYKDRKLKGEITRISPFVSEIHEQNRTVVVEIELELSVNGIHLKHGLSADVEVILQRRPEALRIPTLALLQGGKVLVVGAERLAETRPVKIGLKNWEFAEVLEGLAPGDSVIVSLESESVKEGVQVTVTQEAER
jgi:HlyD family secretion protein